MVDKDETGTLLLQEELVFQSHYLNFGEKIKIFLFLYFYGSTGLQKCEICIFVFNERDCDGDDIFILDMCLSMKKLSLDDDATQMGQFPWGTLVHCGTTVGVTESKNNPLNSDRGAFW